MKQTRISLSNTLLAIPLLISFGFIQAQPAAANAPAAPMKAPVLVTRFDGNLDTRSARAGDTVVANVVQELKLPDLDIPRGSKIVGTIVAIQSKQAGGGNSSLAVKFDHVELKSGAILRVQGLIVAIGQVATSPGIGFDSVLGRGGVGSTPGLDPNTGNNLTRDDIPAGSSLESVALARKLTSTGATELRGVHTEIKFDSSVMIKVALFKGA